MRTTIKKAGGQAGLDKHFRLHITRLSPLLLLAASTGPTLARLSVAAEQLIGGAA